MKALICAWGGGQSPRPSPGLRGQRTHLSADPPGSERRGLRAEKLLGCGCGWLRRLARAAPWQRTAPSRCGGARAPLPRSRDGSVRRRAPAQAQCGRGGHLRPERGRKARARYSGGRRRDSRAGRGRGRERRVAGAPGPWRRRPALLGGPDGAPGCLPWFGPSRLKFGLVVNFKNRRVHIKSGFLTFLFEMRDLARYGTLGWS